MPFISKTQLTLSYLIKDGHPLLVVFSGEGGRRALVLVSSYLLDAKEIKEKIILFIIVLEPPLTLEN
jgi:hypothetical protein